MLLMGDLPLSRRSFLNRAHIFDRDGIEIKPMGFEKVSDIAAQMSPVHILDAWNGYE